MSVTGRLLRLFGRIGMPRRGWATALGFGMAGTRGPKPLERERPQSDDRAERSER
jgi:hypothetical protein